MHPSDPSCGGTTPLLCESEVVLPQYAVVMLGTNDIGSHVSGAAGDDDGLLGM